MYKKIDCSKYERVFIVGDLHGCYHQFIDALDKERFSVERDLVVSVGDLIDRGKNNIECLNLLYEDWFVAVRGNHDQMALDALFSHNVKDSNHHLYNWLHNGGYWYYDLKYNTNLIEHLIKKVETLPYVIELNLDNNTHFKKIVVSHSDYPDDVYEYGKEIDYFNLLWNRNYINSKDDRIVRGADLFVHGHTPLNEKLQLGNRLYIDTGCVFGRDLTLLRVDNDSVERVVDVSDWNGKSRL